MTSKAEKTSLLFENGVKLWKKQNLFFSACLNLLILLSLLVIKYFFLGFVIEKFF